MATPKLRFKEFDGDYLELRYDKFAPLQRGFDLPVSTIVEGNYPVVFSNGILKKHNEFKAKAPGVVTGRSGTIGNITWVEKDYWPHNTSLWVTNFFNNEPKYVFYFLQKFDVSRFASGSGVPTLNRNDVHAQLINIPLEKEEQTKIASFLSAVDEKISQLTKKHELLSQYKQGMMQKLFSQQIRFKADDGSEFGEWTVSNLGKTTEYFKGFAFKSESYKEDGIRIIRVSDLDKDSIKYQNEAIFLDKNEAQNYLNWEVKKKDIIVTTVGSKPHLIDSAVGRPIFVKNDSEGLLNQNLLVLRPKNENIDAYFIFSQLLDKKYLTHIETIQRGNANQSNITVKDLQDFELSIPCLEEQTKIANFLSAIDQKIEVVAQQIEQAKQWKKGLLQQMFV